MKIALCNDCGQVMEGRYRISCSACNRKRLSYHDAYYEPGTLDYHKWATGLSRSVTNKKRPFNWLTLAVAAIVAVIAFNWAQISSSTYVTKAKHLIATGSSRMWK